MSRPDILELTAASQRSSFADSVLARLNAGGASASVWSTATSKIEIDGQDVFGEVSLMAELGAASVWIVAQEKFGPPYVFKAVHRLLVVVKVGGGSKDAVSSSTHGGVGGLLDEMESWVLLGRDALLVKLAMMEVLQ